MKLRLRRLALRERLFLMIVAPLVLVAILASVARYLQFTNVSRQVYDNTLYSIALTISRDVMQSQGDMLTTQLLNAMTSALGDEIFYRVTGPNGAYVTGYSDAPISSFSTALAPGKPNYYDSVANGVPVRALIMQDYVNENGGKGLATVEVWQTVSQRKALSHDLIFQTMLYFAILVSTAALTVWFGITFGLRPLRELEGAILARTPDDLKPIRRWVPEELTTLVEAMNSLFTRLNTAFALRDAFISDAAHQVRNPIAAIQAQAEAAMTAPTEKVLRERIADVADVARRTGRLTHQLLSMERVRGRKMRSLASPIDIATVVEDTTRSFAERVITQGVAVIYEVTGERRWIQADSILINEVLMNLLDNAVTYAGETPTITVTLRFLATEVWLEVADDGPGISDPLRERVFDRFFRADPDTLQGCGLGLAIVQDIARSHNGRAIVLPDTEGCAIRVILPN